MPACKVCGGPVDQSRLVCLDSACAGYVKPGTIRLTEQRVDQSRTEQKAGCCGGDCSTCKDRSPAEVLQHLGTHEPDGTFTPAKPPEFAPTMEDALEARRMIERYGMTPDEAAVSVDRQKVYGDPWINHFGIAQGIAGILQPWAARIARMEPLPPHVVANILSALKLNRQRMRFHDDNFIDLAVYQRFARAWQREWEASGEEKPIVIPPKPHPKARLVIKWETPEDHHAEPRPASSPTS